MRPPERSAEHDFETTFMTTDTTFVDNPSAPRQPPSSGIPSTRQPQTAGAGRGGIAQGRGRAGAGTRGTRGARPSGLAKPRVRGLR
jgi:DASH complex subunit DAM1